MNKTLLTHIKSDVSTRHTIGQPLTSELSSLLLIVLKNTCVKKQTSCWIIPQHWYYTLSNYGHFGKPNFKKLGLAKMVFSLCLGAFISFPLSLRINFCCTVMVWDVLLRLPWLMRIPISTSTSSEELIQWTTGTLFLVSLSLKCSNAFCSKPEYRRERRGREGSGQKCIAR